MNLLYVLKFEISSRYESIFLKLINNVNLVIFTTININETIVRVETVQTTMMSLKLDLGTMKLEKGKNRD